MSTFEYATIAAVACPIGIVAIVLAAVLFLAWRPDDGPLASDDPTEDTQDLTEAVDEILAVDPPVVPVYIPPVADPDAMTMFRGGAVHVRCVGPKILNDAPPCAGCAVHLDHVLTGA